MIAILSYAVLWGAAVSQASDTNVCVASGQTLSVAKKNYSRQCDLARSDCDVVNGEWFCASFKINGLSSLSLLASANTGLASGPVASTVNLVEPSNQNVIVSQNACIDSDGDGYGWDGHATCKPEPTNARTPASVTVVSVSGSSIISDGVCTDSDGDGWGWNGRSSCKIDSPVTLTVAIADNRTSQPIQSTGSVVANTVEPGNCNKLDSGEFDVTELVTDVFLVAGQSNAVGNNTRYQPQRFRDDQTNDRLIVWTSGNKWEVANPATQVWHGNRRYPNNYNGVFNHPGFQIGRAIAGSDSCRVVAMIATAAPGMAIDYWLSDEDGHYSYIQNKVTSALNALPGKYKVNMIWWMQGEADDDEIVNRYYFKLSTLINQFRSENWFKNDGYFLANETRKSLYANEAIRRLREDGNSYTDYSRGQDSLFDPFPAISNETLSVHFNEVALRKIGDLVAKKYLHNYLSN